MQYYTTLYYVILHYTTLYYTTNKFTVTIANLYKNVFTIY